MKLKKEKQRQRLFLLLLLILIATLVVAILTLVAAQTDDDASPNETKVAKKNTDTSNVANNADEESASEITEKTEVEAVDLQPVINEWANSISGDKGIIIYDLDREEVVGSYHADEDFYTASLYKLFVVYKGYRRVQNGEWKGEASCGTTGYTILECLDLAIRESNSPCAETLWQKIGHDELDRIIAEDFNITDSQISDLISNPTDIMQMMQLFYTHPEITDGSLIAKMKDSFLNILSSSS